MCDRYNNINYVKVTQVMVNNIILGLPSPGDLAVVEWQRNGKFNRNGKVGQNAKLGYLCVRATKGKLYYLWVKYHVIVHLDLNVRSSTQNFRGVVNDGNANKCSICKQNHYIYWIENHS